MIDPEHALPISRQAEELEINRATVYYRPRPVPKYFVQSAWCTCSSGTRKNKLYIAAEGYSSTHG
jgi:hypothetical protein